MSTVERPVSLRQRCDAAVLRAVEALGGEGTRRDILERAERLAAFTPAELALLPPEKHRAKHRRLVDHQLSWALTNLKREGKLENPRWSWWQVPKPQLVAAPDALAEPVTPERLAQLKAMPHREYLKTLEWHHTRLAALARASHRCQLDAGHDTGRLDVHHSTYETKGEERTSDLVVLCGDCHAKHHDIAADAEAFAAVSVPPPSSTPHAAAPAQLRAPRFGLRGLLRRA